MLTTFSEVAARYNVTKQQIEPYLDIDQINTILSKISAAMVELIVFHILSLEDIPSESCVLIASILQKFLDFHNEETSIVTIQFLLTSSLPEIVKAWKANNMNLDSAHIRSLVRARFPPSDHRSTALNKITGEKPGGAAIPVE